MESYDQKRRLGTDGIAVKQEDSMCQAVLLLHDVEWVGAVQVSIGLQRRVSTFTT